MLLRRIPAALLVLFAVAACDEPTLVLPSGVSTSIQQHDGEGTPGPLESPPPLADQAAACITLTIVNKVVLLPDASPPAEAMDPQVVALQIGTLSEDLHQVGLQTSGSVASRVETIAQGLQKDKQAIIAGREADRAWVTTYDSLKAEFGELC